MKNLIKYSLFSLMLFIALIFTSACGSSSSGNCVFFGYPNTTPKTITLSKYKFTLDVGTTDKIIAYVNGEDKTNEVKFTPIKEEFTKDTVATVDRGLITAIKAGTSIFEVSYAGAESVTFTVTSNEPNLPTLEVSKNEIDIELGTDPSDIESIIVTLNGKDVTNEATFISTNENVATVDENGNINIIGEGETQIIIHLDGANDQVVTIKVTLPELEINKSNINLQVGQTEQLTVKLKDEDKTQNATYQSSNTNIATVDENGKITAIGEGTAIITVGVEGAKTAEITVNVYDPENHKIKFQPKSNMYETEDGFVMYKGETGNITVLVGGVDKTASGVYTPADETIVKVDNENEHGKMYALEIGTTSINLHHEEALEGDVKVNVIVKPKPVIEEDSFEMLIGNDRQIVVNLNGNPVTADCTFTTESDIVTVDNNGKVTSKGVGTATVYANYDDGIRVHKIPVTINNSKTLTNDKGVSSTLLIDEERQQMLTILMDTGMISNENDIQDIVQIDDNGMTEIVITIDREDGQKVAVVVYKEENGKQVVRYISTETVQNGEVTVNVGSSVQNIVAQEDQSGTLETVVVPGFYNANDQLIASWQDITGDEVIGGAITGNQVAESQRSTGWQNTTRWDYVKSDWTYWNAATLPNHFYQILKNHTELANATKLVVPDGVTSIGTFAFSNKGASQIQLSLETIVFPNTYTSNTIGNTMCDSNARIKNYTIRSDNLNFDSIDGIIYSEANSEGIHETLIICPTNKTGIRIPNGVKHIKSCGFQYNISSSIGPIDSNADIEFPQTLKSIESHAFGSMPNLVWCEFWDGLETTYGATFCGTTSIRSLYIPDSLTTITQGYDSAYSFYYSILLDCSNVTVYCQTNAQPSGWSTYWNASGKNGSDRRPYNWNISRETYRSNYRN